ncbi:HpcH/HpaI aldolase family protein [Agromyces salentinus]|uniref:4-hydroxy-2-oxoheptanedioate aldolase n=1 Tax=Agromyces salentinus TaxID=269421 RepID=A0ABN2N094_9MICO|nr:HpcH/HpaI aldolase/citrate lyase family protein [Agromyces salentinus]
MPIRLTLPPTLGERIAASDRPLVGAWSCAGSATNAEIIAGSGLDVVLIDAEHSPADLESVLAQLQAVAAYPVAPIVRPPFGDTVTLKRYLDVGVQNLLVPMVDTAEQAAGIVRAVRYPPLGVRGVGSSLARSSRWNRIEGYLGDADSTISVFVQIESATAMADLEEILAVDGVDGVFFGPADLAASMGLLGQQEHPDVVGAVLAGIAAATAAGVPSGVNAFVPAAADRYVAAGASLVIVGADVALLARSTEALADRFIGQRPTDAADDADAPRPSY